MNLVRLSRSLELLVRLNTARRELERGRATRADVQVLELELLEHDYDCRERVDPRQLKLFAPSSGGGR